MKYPKKPAIELNEQEQEILEEISKAHSMEQRLVTRARIILSIAKGEKKQKISTQEGVTRKVVYEWYDRWLDSREKRLAIEANNRKEYKKVIEKILSDEERSGAPPVFTAEEVCNIVALSCQAPESLGLPFTTWTPESLREEVLNRGIVSSISVSSVRRFLKRK